LSRSLLGNNHSNANTFATPRQASRNSTTDHHGTTQANDPDDSQPATLHTPARLPEAPPTCTDEIIGMRSVSSPATVIHPTESAPSDGNADGNRSAQRRT
jgi:hypothetical protein